MSMTQTEIADTLAGIFGDGMTADHVGGHLTCGEANLIAGVLVALDRKDAAVVWLTGHAYGDDSGLEDLHTGPGWPMGEDGKLTVCTWDDVLLTARTYVEQNF